MLYGETVLHRTADGQVGNLLKSRELLNKTYLEKPFAPVASLAVSQVDDIFLRKLNDYLEEHLSNEALSVEMLADTMGMSTSSLYRKVKACPAFLLTTSSALPA